MMRVGIYLIVKGLCIASLALGGSIIGAAVASERGVVTGGVMHSIPGWFKESFLDMAEDVEEAAEAEKHLLLFFHLNGCPYCDRMLEESFESEPLTGFIQQHFDSIAINVQGDREVVFSDELTLTEKALADRLNVWATPAILFLDQNNQPVARVDGYRAAARFEQVLHYVSSKAYQSTSLSDYMQTMLKRDVYALRNSPLFTQTTDLAAIKGPLMVIFEESSCYDCNEFHDGILAHPLVAKELEPFTIVRLDAASEQEMIGPDGRATTPKALAEHYQMIYRPGVLAFDGGKLIRRHDSLLFVHHFKESMRYVAAGYHRHQSYRDYSAARTEELLSNGVDIDLGRPELSRD
ncbi:thioredoxin [Ectothiorhodospiraceae bacterium BW-2]|nr:thioredoxin [Ectothiorhodospiraceae bacterium BW-2]